MDKTQARNIAPAGRARAPHRLLPCHRRPQHGEPLLASFRIETVSDEASGMVFAQAFAEPGGQLIARSEPIFHEHEQAEREIKAMLLHAWPDRAPDAVDASIGV